MRPMYPPIDSKLPRVGTTIFTVMSRLAAEHGAINLSQGFPDFAPPDRLLDLANQHMRQGGAGNQYAPMAGLASLRQAIAEKVAADYGRTVDPDSEITVTSGGTEALFCAIQAIVRAGDEVILLDPAYDSDQPAVDLAGGRAMHVPLQRPGFGVDWQRLRDAITPRTRLATQLSADPDRSDARRRRSRAACGNPARHRCVRSCRRGLRAYGVRWPQAPQRVPTHAELVARSFVVSSFGKTCHATGWKVGDRIAPPRLTQEFQKVHQFVQFVVATPLTAIADFMRECPQHTQELPAFYQRKRDYFAGLLAKTRFKFEPAHSTYFQLVDYSELSDLPDTEFARLLTTQHGVAAIPISVFSADSAAKNERIVRFCFAKHEATLDAAAANLQAAMTANLRVTMIQSDLAWQDPATNRRNLAAHFRGLAGHTDLIVLPEMFTTGFSMEAGTLAETMTGATVAWLREESAAVGCAITGSLIVEEGGRHYNRLVWATPDGGFAHYDKRHLFRMAQEDQHYAAGDQRLVVTLKGWRVCPMVCYDLRFPVW